MSRIPAGWLYVGWGACAICPDEWCRLWVMDLPDRVRAVLAPRICARCRGEYHGHADDQD